MFEVPLFRRDASFPTCRRPFAGWTACGLAGMLAGCANVGQPRPPSLHLPVVADRVSAERTGDLVKLTWHSSAQTTEGDKLRGPITVVVCRGEAKAPSAILTVPCPTVQRLVVQPGENTAEDALPVEFAAGPPELLVYRLELLNSQQRSAGRSLPVFVSAGTAPAAVVGLGGMATRDGIVLTWQRPRSDSDTRVEVHRNLVRASNASAGKTESTQKALFAGGSNQSPGGESVLKAAATTGDSGGMVDHGLMDGDIATYSAQRVRTVQLGGEAYEIRSVPSENVKVTYRTTFPPRAPVGLVTIPTGSINAPGGLSIDLSWEPNTEDGIAGYNLYRAEQTGEGDKPVLTRLNPALLPGPSFHDLHLAAAHSYLYRVTAVDEHGNESVPGATVEERVAP